MKTQHSIYPTTKGKVLIGGMWFFPDDSRYFSAPTARRAFFDDETGRLTLRDDRGNYAHSSRKFRSEHEWDRASGWRDC